VARTRLGGQGSKRETKGCVEHGGGLRTSPEKTLNGEVAQQRRNNGIPVTAVALVVGNGNDEVLQLR
jgi:hypothetical protein